MQRKVRLCALLFFLTPAIAFSDSLSLAQPDKQKHLAASTGITLGSSYVLEKSGASKLESVLLGSLISTLAGLSKEYLLDERPSRGDLFANGIGTILGAGASYTIRF